MARKRSPPKSRTVNAQNVARSKQPASNRTAASDTISSDFSFYIRLFLIIAVIIGFSGFLLYPDILSVVKTVQQKISLNLYSSEDGNVKPGNAGSSSQQYKSKESVDVSATTNRPPADDAWVDDDYNSEAAEDEVEGDLMEDEELEKEQQKLQNLKDERQGNQEKHYHNTKDSATPVQSGDSVGTGNSKKTSKKEMSSEDSGNTRSGGTEEKLTGKPVRKTDPPAETGNAVGSGPGSSDKTSAKKKSSKDSHNTKPNDTVEKPVRKPGSKTGPIILTAENNEIVLDPSQIEIINSENTKGDESPKRKEKSSAASNGNSNKKSQQKQTKPTKSNEPTKDAPDASKTNEEDEIKNFKPTFHRMFTPKKIFAGGRRIPPVELLHQKESNSSVRVFLFDDFLSKQECDGLMRAHDSHVKAMDKPPLLCFDSIATLKKHIKDVKKKVKVTPNDFTKGTKCLNTTFSRQMQNWLKSNWSYSTAFYPGESKFSEVAAHRIEQSMGLDPVSGGKFQITSYPVGKAYKEHTDCVVDGVDKRDRVVSVLMYLNDVEDGGETAFPELGIWVRPKKGRALVWNNMSPEGECEPHSRHVAKVVKKGSKYILIRWYYYKTFYSLGKRPPPPPIPEREADQPMVSCDEYNSGSCRWYDEWSYEPLLDYEKNRMQLI